VIEGLAVGTYLDLGLLAAGAYLGLVGDEFVVLGEGLYFHQLAPAGSDLQAVFDGSGQGVERDLFLDFNDGAGWIHEHVFGVAVHDHLDFVVGLAVFFFLRETFHGCADVGRERLDTV